MEKKDQIKRRYEVAKTCESKLGPLSLLPGKWKGVGTGWNMIALPFDQAEFDFRLLMNQYDETLEFSPRSSFLLRPQEMYHCFPSKILAPVNGKARAPSPALKEESE